MVVIGKVELTKKVRDRFNSEVKEGKELTHEQADLVVETILDVIKDEINAGNAVSIPKFGRFEPVVRSERKMDNYVTAQHGLGEITIPEKRVPVLRVSKCWQIQCDEAK